MEEVTKKQFYSFVGALDIHPKPIGNYPYTSLWKTQYGVVRAKTINFEDKGQPKTKYYISE